MDEPPRAATPHAAGEPAHDAVSDALSFGEDVVDVYAMLDLPYTCNAPDARRRLRHLAKECHPDRNRNRNLNRSGAGPDADLNAAGRFARLSAAAAMFDDEGYVQVLQGAVTIAASELDGLARAGNNRDSPSPSPAALRARVAEVLYEIKSRTEMLGREEPDPSTAAAASTGSTADGSGQRKRRSGHRKHRKKQAAAKKAGYYSKPSDPSQATRHLFIANTGPRFGISAVDVQLALKVVVADVGNVVAPNPNASHVYASFGSAAAAAAARDYFGRAAGAGAGSQSEPPRSLATRLLCGRPVSMSYAEVSLPLVAAAGASDMHELTPAELLLRVRREMNSLDVDEEAGNLPMQLSAVLVRCPLCSSPDAEYQRGRPLRMHLMSSVHGLTGEVLSETVMYAESLSRCTARREGEVGLADIEREATAANPHPGQTRGGGGGGSGGEVAARQQEDGAGADWFSAAQHGDIQALQLLAQANADPNATDRHGSTALHWAAGSGRLDACKFLVDVLGVDGTQACVTGRKDRRNALHWAARNGQTHVCSWLVGTVGLGVNSMTVDGTSAFHWAVWQGHFACSRWLRDHGADVNLVNTYGCNGVHWAALCGNLQMCMWLAKLGLHMAVVNNQGHTPLHKAAFKGHATVCTWLLRSPLTDAHAVDNGGYTPAMIATERGFHALGRMLAHHTP